MDDFVKAIVELDISASLTAVDRLNNFDVTPREIMSTCERALLKIWERYKNGEYYISGLIMAGEIISRVIKRVMPHMISKDAGFFRGRILIGTVKGDIHSLGKNIAGALLSAHGFVVKDLGVDVSRENFIFAVKSFQPDIVGLSVLLTSCFSSMIETIEAIKQVRRDSLKPVIFVSGAQVTPKQRNIFAADYLVETAFDTVKLCESICSDRP
jgi:5-methyltetrahydrofolate--homocysteine methyltransferase